MNIWKFPLLIGTHGVRMPEGARPLKVAMQYGVITLWALVDPRRPEKEIRISVVGTGWDLPEEDYATATYLGTVADTFGFVWHAFMEARSL